MKVKFIGKVQMVSKKMVFKFGEVYELPEVDGRYLVSTFKESFEVIETPKPKAKPKATPKKD